MADDSRAEVWVKMEAANPTGSYKDRMALAMIEAAGADGRLRPGQPVVEYTGGSTGSSLAFVCAVKGYPLRIVSSDAFAEEKIRTMRAFGAEVELIPSPDGITPDLIPAARAFSPGRRPARTSPPRWTSPAGSAPATAWSPSRSTAKETSSASCARRTRSSVKAGLGRRMTARPGRGRPWGPPTYRGGSANATERTGELFAAGGRGIGYRGEGG
jgi:hypothetical protein